jgi:hypothetical protein
MNEIRELTEMDLKAVSGGGLIPSITTDTQIIVAAPTTLAISVGGDATAFSQLGLKNILSHKH